MIIGSIPLHARLLAWPLVSKEAFAEGLFALEKVETKGRFDRERAAATALREAGRGLSLEQLQGIVRLAWQELPGPDLLDGLRALAKGRLRCGGDRQELVGAVGKDGIPEAHSRTRQRWYALTGEVPGALLQHAVGARSLKLRLDPPIQRLLQRDDGVAEQHSHLGSAQRFEALWHAAMVQMAAEEDYPTDPNGPEIVCGARLEELVAHAALARGVLWWMRRRDRVSLPTLGDPWAQDLLRGGLGWLRCPEKGGRVVTPARLQAQFDWLLRDPPGEAEFQRTMWDWAAGLSVDFVRRLFLQYLRAYALVWRELTLEDGTAGLDWFRQTYRRLWGLTRWVDGKNVEPAFAAEATDLRLGSVEWRIMPPKADDAKEFLDTVAQAVKVLRRGEPGEVGFVLHFPKPDDDLCKEPFGRMAWSEWLDDHMARAATLVDLLDRYPPLLVLVRGLDVCNLELTLPLWPTLLPIDRCKRAGEAAARALLRRPGFGEVPALRMTYHCGEEHRHLQDGLRRMDELIEFAVLDVGDRVGHGLALGRDVEAWCDQWPVAVTLVRERLDDLLWEWEAASRRALPMPPGRHLYVQSEILRLGREMFGEPEVTVEDLVRARRLRHHRPLLRAVFDGCPPKPQDRAQRIALAHLTSPGAFKRGAAPVEVVQHPTDREALQAMQAHVRARYAHHHITVEANPQSNLTIGGLRRMADHPMFRLQPIERAGSQSVPVSINCDNLLVGDTNLSIEYQRAWTTLLDEGHPSDQVLEWLERARRAGMDARFTLPMSKDAQVLRWFVHNFPGASGALGAR